MAFVFDDNFIGLMERCIKRDHFAAMMCNSINRLEREIDERQNEIAERRKALDWLSGKL